MDEYGDEGDDSAQPSSSDTETSDNGGVTTSGWCGGDGSIGNKQQTKNKTYTKKVDIGHYLSTSQSRTRRLSGEVLLSMTRGMLKIDSGLSSLKPTPACVHT